MPKPNLKKKKQIKRVFHIFCEGAKTEPYYIKDHIDHKHSTHKNILVVENTKKNTPVQLVEVAIAAKNSEANHKDDIYWVVYDREGIAKYSHELHLKARKLADRNGINIAISNVCFELWFLFHFENSAKPYINCDELLKQSNLKSYLKDKGLKIYDKGYAKLFDLLKGEDDLGLKNASINAKRINLSALKSAESDKTDPSYLNPYTNVYELFDAMDKFVKEI